MNFLCISAFHPTLDWVLDCKNPYVIYNKTGNPLPQDFKNVIDIPNTGYNIYDMLKFTIDYYENLPETVVFCKSNVFPRHVTEEFFLSIKDSTNFKGIFQKELHTPSMPMCRFSKDGYWEELNNSWYMGEGKEMVYYKDFNSFFQDFFLTSPPTYVEFTPGGNFVVPRENILKFSKTFYENLLPLVSYTQLPGEAHILERTLHGMWKRTYIPNPKMTNSKIIK